MICPKCGASAEENAVVCPSCGETLPTVTTVAEKPKKSRKPLMITSAVLAGAVVIGVPTFFAVKNAVVRKALEENPTKYVLSSAKEYMAQVGSDNDVFHALADVKNKGTVKASYQSDEDGEISYLLSIDKQEVYAEASMKNGQDTSFVKVYNNADALNLDYDAMGKQGSYFVNYATLQEDYNASALAGKFDEVIDQYESFQNFLKKEDSIRKDVDKLTDDLIGSFEKNGHAAVSSGTVTVNGKAYSADMVQYHFDYTDFGNFLEEAKNAVIAFYETNSGVFGTDEENMADFKEGLNNAVSDYKSAAKQDMTIDIQCAVDTGTQRILQTEWKIANVSNDEVVTLSIDFPVEDDVIFDLKAHVSSASDSSVNGDARVTLNKSVSGQVYTYDLNATAMDKQVLSLAMEYDKANAAMKIKSGNGGQEYTLSSFFTAMRSTNDFTIKFDFECQNNTVVIKDDKFRLELSADSSITPFKGEKNLFQLTEEELNELTGGTSIIASSEESAKKSDAAALDVACKQLYADVASGSLNADTSPEELGNLSADKLPPANATTAQKREFANKLTVKDAIEYCGLEGVFLYQESTNQYGYSLTDGTIIYSADDTIEDLTQYVFLTDFESTTLGELYNRN